MTDHYTVTCPSCRTVLITIPPDNAPALRACPNRAGGCGREWWAAGRPHYEPHKFLVMPVTRKDPP